jgi:hypothetical protein
VRQPCVAVAALHGRLAWSKSENSKVPTSRNLPGLFHSSFRKRGTPSVMNVVRAGFAIDCIQPFRPLLGELFLKIKHPGKITGTISTLSSIELNASFRLRSAFVHLLREIVGFG